MPFHDELSLAALGDSLAHLHVGVFAHNRVTLSEYSNAPLRGIVRADRDRRRLVQSLRAAEARATGADETFVVPFTTESTTLDLRVSRVGSWIVGVLECRQAGAEPPAPMPSSSTLAGRFGLTRRERDVAEQLARGCKNNTIAATLGISPFTVRRHTERVLTKLGVQSRAEVAAVMLGILGHERKAG